MSAWVLALYSLLQLDPSLLWTRQVPTPRPSREVLVYLDAVTGQSQAPLDHMKRELSVIMQAAGFRLVYADLRNPDRAGRFAELIVLELRGSCGMAPGSYRLERSVASGASLAETAMSGGAVMPFSHINCANLTRLIGPVLADEAGAQRDFLYGRAMARVAAHELYHVIMASRDHAHGGVGKPSFTVADLLDERFEFDRAALAQLRQKSGDGFADAATERR